METKDFALEVKDLTEAGTFEGYASVFANTDSYGDIVEPGAFVKSLSRHAKAKTKPLLLWQHNPTTPIGVWDTLAEDEKGLRGTGRLLPGVRLADEALILMRGGAVQGLSIGYRVVKFKMAGEVRHLTELDLMEASIVSFPANEKARVENVKMKLAHGALPSLPEFEDILREAGFSKTQSAVIANRGLKHLLDRSESEGEVTKKMALLKALMPAAG